MIGTTANNFGRAPWQDRPPATPSDGRLKALAGQVTGRPGLRVLVFVCNELIRCGLSTMLSALPTVEHFDVAESPGDATRLLGAGHYDVVILPCDELSRELDLEATRPDARVLLLLSDADHQRLDSVVCNRCDGFLLQSELTASSLHDAMARLVQGELPMPSSLARELLSHARRNGSVRSPRPILLTPRERETLALIVEGLSNKQIARRLGISEHGAKRHVATVLAKLNCPNRALAVAIALREKLLQDS